MKEAVSLHGLARNISVLRSIRVPIFWNFGDGRLRSSFILVFALC